MLIKMFKATVKGTLLPIGGNEDKGTRRDESSKLTFVQKGILSRVIKECKKPDPLIVVIPTASSIPVEVGEKYVAAFGQLDCNNIQVLDIRERSQAEDLNTLHWIKKADCVMFSGGNQSRITRIIRDTPLHHLLMDRYQNEGKLSLSRSYRL